MTYLLTPEVPGELGPGTDYDASATPHNVGRVEFVLDRPGTDDLITSHPVYLVSTTLSNAIQKGGYVGARFDRKVRISRGDAYRELHGRAGHGKYERLHVVGSSNDDIWLHDEFHALAVSDPLMDLLRGFRLDGCDVSRLRGPGSEEAVDGTSMLDVIQRLREVRGEGALSVARTLAELHPGELDHWTLLQYFMRGFPGIPFEALTRAEGWVGVGGSELSDEDFERHMTPWLS